MEYHRNQYESETIKPGHSERVKPSVERWLFFCCRAALLLEKSLEAVATTAVPARGQDQSKERRALLQGQRDWYLSGKGRFNDPTLG
jgi:hypothetical protein